MSSIAIPNLPPVLALSGAEMIEVVQAGTSCRATIAQVAAAISGGLNPSLVMVATASETIAAGAFVNLYVSASALMVRNASATSPTLFANGYSIPGIASGNSGLIVGTGLNFAIAVTGVTSGSSVWLSDTVPGSYQATVPTTRGHIIQPLGVASPGTGIFFSVQPAIQL